MRDEDLRNPLREPPPRSLTAAELERESPREGVDVEQARVAAEQSARVQQTKSLPEGSEPGHG
jgi:hypothetical protein